jgi:hypothetical protein
MSESPRLDRKHFLKLTISVAGSGAAAWLVGCSSEDPADPGSGGATNGGSAGTTGGAGKGGAGTGGAGTSGGGAGSGGGGTSSGGAGTSAGGAGSAGKAGAGGGSGTAGASGAGTGGGGAGGAGAGGGGSGGAAGGVGGGSGGTAGGGTSGSGGALGGAGSGGKGGASGAAGSGGKSACGTTLNFSQNANCMPEACNIHDHVPMNQQQATEFFEALLEHIMGPDATMPFELPMEGPGVPHTHELIFTQQEIDTLRSGGTLMNKTHEPDDIGDVHIYTISCA